MKQIRLDKKFEIELVDKNSGTFKLTTYTDGKKTDEQDFTLNENEKVTIPFTVKLTLESY